MERVTTRRLVLGAVLVVIGVLLLLDNFDFFALLPFELREAIFNWPMLFMLIGLISFVSSRKKVVGVIFFGLGAYLWTSRYIDINLSWLRDFWPVAIILIGVYILLKHSRNTSAIDAGNTMNGPADPSGDLSSTDYIDEVAIFGGGDRNISSQAFKGGKATCIFGGSDINFKNTKLVNDQAAVIDLLCVFGGVSMKVPKDWTVHSEVTPLLGGFGDDRDHSSIHPDPRKVLIIKGLVIFGGADIKSA